MNLGWKLAGALRGSVDLLDTYEAERHPVGEQVLKLTDAFNQLVLGRSPIRLALQTFAIRTIIHFGSTDTGRLYELLRAGKFVLVSPNTVDRNDVVHAVHGDTTMLVRPDGYIAWESDKPVSGEELAKQVERWCGRLSTATR